MDNMDANQCSEAIVQAITEISTTTIDPRAKRRRSVHWWTQEIADLRKEANHARRVYQRKLKKTRRSECAAEEEIAKSKKLDLVKAIKRGKEQAWKRLCDLVDREPWGTAYKIVMGKLQRKRPIPELTTPGRLDKIISGLFPTHRDREETQWPNECHRQATAEAIRREELEIAVSSLKRNKAPGLDGVTNEMGKLVARKFSDMLLATYNKCLLEGKFPRKWKTARLVLIRKGDKPLDDPSSYRPICLLDCLGKMFEKIIDNRLRGILEGNSGLADCQYGFRKKRSTIDALNHLKRIVQEKGTRKRTGVLTMDVKNAFNSAPWLDTMNALWGKEVPLYLCRLVDHYLSDRRVIYEADGQRAEVKLTYGVPQGSVLGPTLWNVLYDDLLRVPLPEGVEYLAFADDVALVATAKDAYELEEKLTVAAERVSSWLESTGLKLAVHKSEVVVITRKRKNNDIKVTIKGTQIKSSRSIKYLGIQIDDKMMYTEHGRTVATKAGNTLNNLARIMPNLSAARQKRRRLLAGVIQSHLLYGAEAWAEDMSQEGWKQLGRVQRKAALRVACAYRTVSKEAIMVVSGIIPIDILALERHRCYAQRKGEQEPPDPGEPQQTAMDQWQEKWEATNETEERIWTRRLIRDVREWTGRRHGEVDFHITQALTGHGCFARRELNMTIGEEVTADNMVSNMLLSKAKWNAISNYIHHVLTRKENEERRRKGLPVV
ncbi:hypothetical protein QTP88_029006 [Uroleucon formosanum]